MKTNKRKLGQTHLFVPIRVIRGHNSFHGSNSFRTSNFGVCLRLAIRWWSRGVCLAFARISHRRSTRQIFERGQPPKAPHRRPRFREFIRLISDCFQNPNVQCSLNEANPQRMPLYSKLGIDHFSVSFTSGQVSCTSARTCLKTGLAKSPAFSI